MKLKERIRRWNSTERTRRRSGACLSTYTLMWKSDLLLRWVPLCDLILNNFFLDPRANRWKTVAWKKGTFWYADATAYPKHTTFDRGSFEHQERLGKWELNELFYDQWWEWSQSEFESECKAATSGLTLKHESFWQSKSQRRFPDGQRL